MEEFLKSTTVKQMLEKDGPFLFTDIRDDQTVASTLETLASHKLTSLPVLETSTSKYIGIIDTLDIVAFVAMKFSVVSLLAHESYRQMDEFAQKKVKDILHISGRNEYLAIMENSSLKDTIKLLSKPDIHRVMVVNEKKEFVGLVTQSKLVEFLLQNNDKLTPTMAKQVEQWEPRVNLVEIKMNQFVIEAFKTIFDKQVSGVAVTNDEGELVGNISASDVKHLRVQPIGELIHDLYQPIKHFMNIRSSMKERVMMANLPKSDPIFVTKTNTMEEVLQQIVSNGVHRVFVVDDNKKPMDVISLRDILVQFN